jgi:hypothetical protein
MTKPQQFNFAKSFNHWFYDEQYPELGSNRCQVYAYGNPANSDNRDYWMREAYVAGALAMATDILSVLADWACAVEGLDPELVTPAEIYDRARENLWHYTQLDLF